MQYADFIQFESLDSIIEIGEADQTDRAKQLVATYVISEEMAFRFINLAFVQLRMDALSEHKGLLIIGNYGTGKSHLMAVISCIAENASYLKYLKHSKVAQTAQAIAGKFKVLRTEIGATTMSLRDMLTQALENYLATLGIPFHFPPADTIINNKQTFNEMMTAVTAHYPQQGLLLVVDELLDYLRTRSDQALILDLNFLREIGEVCKESNFRFIAGLQETIFDNQRFEFVANVLRRVKDRFEQILITRQDIKFVVAERLLKKTPTQKMQIEQYLKRFAPCYGNLTERLAEFVALFPVHPDYIDIFERITVIEKREVLKTIESSMQQLICQEIPTTYPGLLAYDNYWLRLRENPSFRATPDIRELIENVQLLENRLQQAFTRPAYKPMALRIIHGLAIHRLTTPDIGTPVGVTVAELRDSLCLYLPGIQDLSKEPADDLLSLVETVLREIMNTVNRQFISANPENGQYYIDLKKNYDYDAIIEKRAESLENHQLDRYYFAALRQVMEITDQPTGNHPNFNWMYELEWRSHRVTRQGYLVFGAPNQSTMALANTDTSFLLYFLPIYTAFNESFATLSLPKEVFFRLTKVDTIFTQMLRLYTAASDLAITASGHAKMVYESKAQTYLREILQWLQMQKATAFEITYQGHRQPLFHWLNMVSAEDWRVKNKPALFTPHPSLLDNFRDLIDLVADVCLEGYFHKLAPEYPIFPILISKENLTSIVQETLRGIAYPQRCSKQARGILAALLLLTDEQWQPTHSKYAQAILQQLQQKPPEQVLNRQELLIADDFIPSCYQLEPELVMILITALVAAGEIVLVMPGQIIDVSTVTELVNFSVKELLAFKHLQRPKAFNSAAVKALVELLALPQQLEVAIAQNELWAVQQLQTKVNEWLSQLLQIQPGLNRGMIFWGKPLFTETERQSYQNSFVRVKNFLESIENFSTPLKFKNFPYAAGEIMTYHADWQVMVKIFSLQTLLTEFQQAVAYFTAAEAVLPPNHAWLAEMNQVRHDLLLQLADYSSTNHLQWHSWQSGLNMLQQDYVQVYLDLHQQRRLGESGEKLKQRLLMDQRLFNLRNLSALAILPHQQLIDFEKSLVGLPVCYQLQERELRIQVSCPHCGYRPVAEWQVVSAHASLVQLEETLGNLYRRWTEILLGELETAFLQAELLKSENRSQLASFLAQRVLPGSISVEFFEALQEGLSNLERVVVTVSELTQALSADGSPLTVAEFQQRLRDFLMRILGGKVSERVRIVLEE